MIPGLTWRDNGQAVLSGPLLDLATSLDRAFVDIAASFGAEDIRFPPLMDVDDLALVDWFESFPHLATMAVAFDAEAEDVASFAHGHRPGRGNVRAVLTPAACYHAYVHLRGTSLDAPLALTTRNTCFRRESHYVPLERQWAFDMREIVFVGRPEEVAERLDAARAAAQPLLDACGLDVEWCHATDPFFQPVKNPAYLLQRLQPVKYEAVFDRRLAIASTNVHHDHFGAAFAISRNGESASSGCLAFGVHRWLAAIIAVHGAEPRHWPDPEAVRCG